MLQRILVPLDGSELAEAVLPYVREISQRCEPAEVILLRVVRPPSAGCVACHECDDVCPTEITPSLQMGKGSSPSQALDCVLCHDCQAICSGFRLANSSHDTDN